VSQGGNAVANGKQMESIVIEHLKGKDYTLTLNKRIHWSTKNYYIPDIIIDNSTVVELKYQQVAGSAQNKLSQALLELQWMHNTIGYDAVLVISGDKLLHVINNDPAFQLAKVAAPDVKVVTLEEFYTLY
jgi:hypothetical protein